MKYLNYGINVHELKIGTLVIVVTHNSVYRIIKDEGDQFAVIIQGGKKFLKPTKVNFSGSTFGGTILKLGWIGYQMNMEIHIPDMNKVCKTTGVIAAKVVGDGWEYDMDWEK